MRRFLALAACVTLLATIPLTASAQTGKTSWGAPQPIGNGTVRTYVTRDADGTPVEIGYALSAGALDSLPPPVGDDFEASVTRLVLPMPENAPAPYTFALFDYNALGHPPKEVYGVPHFDFHFYLVPDSERMKIQPGPDWDAEANAAPEADMMPAGYILPPGTAVPEMGTHWVDPASPELNGKPFTHTFIYGTWNGRLIFVEPMITVEDLRSGVDLEKDVPTPEKVARPGWYPTRYRVYTDPATSQIRVALTGLVRKE